MRAKTAFCLALAALILSACSKAPQSPRGFVFGRADSPPVHDAWVRTQFKDLRAKDPDAYLALLRKERGDSEWLDALKIIHPDRYDAALAETAHTRAATTPNLTQPLSSDATPDQPSTPWRYASQIDEMRGKVSAFACAPSTNQLSFAFPYSGGSTGQLCLRHSAKFGDDVYLSIDNGQFLCSPFGCRVHVKFDDDAVATFQASPPSDATTNAIFIRGFARFVRHLRTAKRAIVEAQYFQEGDQQLVFNVENLDWK